MIFRSLSLLLLVLAGCSVSAAALVPAPAPEADAGTSAESCRVVCCPDGSCCERVCDDAGAPPAADPVPAPVFPGGFFDDAGAGFGCTDTFAPPTTCQARDGGAFTGHVYACRTNGAPNFWLAFYPACVEVESLIPGESAMCCP